MPQDYQYTEGSAKSDGQILFFSIHKQNANISLSEQAMPDRPPDLHTFKDFKKLNVLNGDGIIGRTAGRFTAIILTNTTLITLTASKDVPNDSLITLAENLKPVDG
jgi:hypothetical protein